MSLKRVFSESVKRINYKDPLYLLTIFFKILNFSALLDYVNSAHEIEIRPSPVRRLCRSSLCTQSSDFFQIFSYCFPWAMRLDLFECSKRNIFQLFTIYFVFVNMGPNGSEKFSKTLFLLQIPDKNCPLNGPHKSRLGMYEILKTWIFNYIFFLFFGGGIPNGSENFKRSYQSQLNFFTLVLHFSLNDPHKKSLGILYDYRTEQLS